jgi:hypothetical protein
MPRPYATATRLAQIFTPDEQSDIRALPSAYRCAHASYSRFNRPVSTLALYRIRGTMNELSGYGA